MQKLFTSRETSLKLRAAGFSEPCIGYYVGKDEQVYVGSKDVLPPFNPDIDSKVMFRAVLYQQVIDWLRKSHDLYITQEPHKDGQYSFYCQTENGMIETYGEYYEALNEMITDTLKAIDNG